MECHSLVQAVRSEHLFAAPHPHRHAQGQGNLAPRAGLFYADGEAEAGKGWIQGHPGSQRAQEGDVEGQSRHLSHLPSVPCKAKQQREGTRGACPSFEVKPQEKQLQDPACPVPLPRTGSAAQLAAGSPLQTASLVRHCSAGLWSPLAARNQGQDPPGNI